MAAVSLPLYFSPVKPTTMTFAPRLRGAWAGAAEAGAGAEDSILRVCELPIVSLGRYPGQG